jgi:hypothetical protein
MALTILRGNQSIDELSTILQAKYPDLKLNKANKTTLIIQNGKIMAVVRVKKDKITVSGDLNTKNFLIMGLMVMGILCGLVGVLLIFAILYIIYAARIKHFKNEVFEAIK